MLNVGDLIRLKTNICGRKSGTVCIVTDLYKNGYVVFESIRDKQKGEVKSDLWNTYFDKIN